MLLITPWSINLLLEPETSTTTVVDISAWTSLGVLESCKIMVGLLLDLEGLNKGFGEEMLLYRKLNS